MLTCCCLGRKVFISVILKHMGTMDSSAVDRNLECLHNGISVECMNLDSIKPTFKMLAT